MLESRNKLRDLLAKPTARKISRINSKALSNSEHLSKLSKEIEHIWQGGKPHVKYRSNDRLFRCSRVWRYQFTRFCNLTAKTEAEEDNASDNPVRSSNKSNLGCYAGIKTLRTRSILLLLQSMTQSRSNLCGSSPKISKTWGSWRGLPPCDGFGNWFWSQNSQQLGKKLRRDLERAVEFDQSLLFKKTYEDGFSVAGGDPYAALIGDFEFSSSPDDISLLKKMSNVAAAGFCPFISAASSQMFGLDSFEQLSNPRDLEKIFDSSEYIPWRASVTMTLDSYRWHYHAPWRAYPMVPRPNRRRIQLRRMRDDPWRRHLETDHDKYCWMNAAYSMGTVLTRAFSEYGLHKHPWSRKRRYGKRLTQSHRYEWRRWSCTKIPYRDPITDRREADWANSASYRFVIIKHRLRCVLWFSNNSKSAKVWWSKHDCKCWNFYAPALHHGNLSHRALPKSDGAR